MAVNNMTRLISQCFSTLEEYKITHNIHNSSKEFNEMKIAPIIPSKNHEISAELERKLILWESFYRNIYRKNKKKNDVMEDRFFQEIL